MHRCHVRSGWSQAVPVEIADESAICVALQLHTRQSNHSGGPVHDNDNAGHPPYYYLDTAHYADYSSKLLISAPTLTITRSDATHVTVSWAPGGGRLEASSSLAPASWVPIGTANPAVVPISGTPQFFRVINP